MPRKRSDSQPLVIVAGDGGWAELEWRGIVAYVRFVIDDERRRTLRIAELLVLEPWVRRHRDVPLSRIENAVHADAIVRSDLDKNLGVPLSRDDLETFFQMKESIAAGMSPRQKLKRPTTRRLGDDFYAEVARAYTDAVAFGLNPRKTLAEDADAPADTVARWIMKARKKGYLSAGEPGKASGAIPEASDG